MSEIRYYAKCPKCKTEYEVTDRIHNPFDKTCSYFCEKCPGKENRKVEWYTKPKKQTIARKRKWGTECGFISDTGIKYKSAYNCRKSDCGHYEGENPKKSFTICTHGLNK